MRTEPTEGERFLPESDGPDLAYEHTHRYVLAGRLLEGLRVLDLACGSGYGRSWLEQASGKPVVSLDLERSVLRGAGREVCASAEALPFADRSFQAVVFFEAIEHVASPEAVLDEVRRILRPPGLLLVSTPDRDIYTDRAGHRNEHHVSELSREEFARMLGARFSHVALRGQSVVAGSWVGPIRSQPLADSDAPDTRAVEVLRDPLAGAGALRRPAATSSGADAPLPEPVYLFAACATGRAGARRIREQLPADSWLHDPDQWYVGQYGRLIEDAQAQRHELDRARQLADSQARDLHRARDTIEVLEKQLESARTRADAQREELRAARDAADASHSELRRAGAAVASLEAQLAEAFRGHENQEAQLRSAREVIAAKDRELETSRAVFEGQDDQLRASRLGIEDLQAQLSASRGLIEDQQAQLDTSRATIEDQQSQLAASRTAIEDQQSQLDTSRTTIEDQQSQLAASRAAIEDQQSQLAASRTTIEDQQSQLVTSRATIEDQQSQLAASRTTIEDQQSQLAASRTAIDEQQTQLRGAADAIAAKDRELEIARESAQDHQAQLAAAREGIENLQSQLRVSGEALLAKDRELERAAQANRSLERDVAQLATSVEQARAAEHTLSERLDDHEQLRSELERELRHPLLRAARWLARWTRLGGGARHPRSPR